MPVETYSTRGDHFRMTAEVIYPHIQTSVLTLSKQLGVAVLPATQRTLQPLFHPISSYRLQQRRGDNLG